MKLPLVPSTIKYLVECDKEWLKHLNAHLSYIRIKLQL